ncbi:hypothetical protein AB0K60_07205 [Thermopolyspora sp. NPDC052614]|uniref:hypothetical protein n=1 Tax=Thermopolyspora sp. NPDC052614 TaxID=3155682 RepID=UPI003446B22B
MSAAVVAEPTDGTVPESGGILEPSHRPYARGHIQMPKSLLRSPDHSALAVVVWAYYETLTVPRIEGGVRGPRRVAQIRRGVVADALGVSDKALDRARRELFHQDVPGGAWLSRSRPRGFQRSVLHSVLRLPGRTGEPYARVPNWTLDLVHGGRGRAPRRR